MQAQDYTNSKMLFEGDISGSYYKFDLRHLLEDEKYFINIIPESSSSYFPWGYKIYRQSSEMSNLDLVKSSWSTKIFQTSVEINDISARSNGVGHYYLILSTEQDVGLNLLHGNVEVTPGTLNIPGSWHAIIAKIVDRGDNVFAPTDIKTRVIKAAHNLNSYSIKSSMTQTLKLNSGPNATTEKLVTIIENAETVALIDLSNFKAHAYGSTKNQMDMPGKPVNTSTTSADVYQIGSSTYVNDESGNWTHLADPRSMQEVWGPDRNNQVKAIAATFNLSATEDLGSGAINGEDAYKLKIVTGSGDQINLQNAAFAIAARVTQYPMYLPSVNRTELNETGKMEKTIWISKKSYLPVKYQSTMSFTMTPEIIGALDPNTSQMKMFNQSLRLGEISVSIEMEDLYYDFDKPTDIILPEQALSAPVIKPTQVQANDAM
jgi:hypothetical protein